MLICGMNSAAYVQVQVHLDVDREEVVAVVIGYFVWLFGAAIVHADFLVLKIGPHVLLLPRVLFVILGGGLARVLLGVATFDVARG